VFPEVYFCAGLRLSFFILYLSVFPCDIAGVAMAEKQNVTRPGRMKNLADESKGKRPGSIARLLVYESRRV
jgi:hypothetical protein